MLRVHIGNFTPTKSDHDFFVLRHTGVDVDSIKDFDPELICDYCPSRNVFYGGSLEELCDALSKAMEKLDFLEKIEILAEEDVPLLGKVVEFLREQNPRKKIDLFYEGTGLEEGVVEMVDSVILGKKRSSSVRDKKEN